MEWCANDNYRLRKCGILSRGKKGIYLCDRKEWRNRRAAVLEEAHRAILGDADSHLRQNREWYQDEDRDQKHNLGDGEKNLLHFPLALGQLFSHFSKSAQRVSHAQRQRRK